MSQLLKSRNEYLANRKRQHKNLFISHLSNIVKQRSLTQTSVSLFFLFIKITIYTSEYYISLNYVTLIHNIIKNSVPLTLKHIEQFEFKENYT